MSRPPVRFVTSFDERLFEASGRRCVDSFVEMNPDLELIAYVEPSVEAYPHLRKVGVRAEDLSRKPLLGRFLRHLFESIPRSLGGGGADEDFEAEGPEAGDAWFRKNMFRWFRKVVALDHAAGAFNGCLFWVDCDCIFTKPIPPGLIEEIFGEAAYVHMRGDREVSETGVMGWDLRKRGSRRFLRELVRLYMSREILALRRWDDSFATDTVLRRHPDIPSRDLGGRAGKNGQILPSTVLGPFVFHDKGLHGRELRLYSE